MENNLGCGERVNINKPNGFICGVPDGNGQETFCSSCKAKMKAKWKEEDSKRENYLNENHFQFITKSYNGGQK
jgi:hypothetical protein